MALKFSPSRAKIKKSSQKSTYAKLGILFSFIE